MKKSIAVVVGILSLVCAKAFSVNQTVILGCPTASTYNVTVSTTPKLILSANTSRRGVIIYNPNAYSIRITTFSNTSASVGFNISPATSTSGGFFRDEVAPYQGDLYAISVNSNAVTGLDIYEKSCPSY